MISKNQFLGHSALFSTFSAACVLMSACNSSSQDPATPPSTPPTPSATQSASGNNPVVKPSSGPTPYWPPNGKHRVPPSGSPGASGTSGASGASASSTANEPVNGAEATPLNALRTTNMEGQVEAPFISKASKGLSASTWVGCAQDVGSALENGNTGFLLLQGSSVAFERDLMFTYGGIDSLYNGTGDRALAQFFCVAPDDGTESGRPEPLPQGTVVKAMKVGDSITDTLKFSATNVVHDFKGSHRATITCTDSATLNATLKKNGSFTGIQLLKHSSLVVVRDNEYDVLGMLVKNPTTAPYAVYTCE
jgi:hypothetical protein